MENIIRTKELILTYGINGDVDRHCNKLLHLVKNPEIIEILINKGSIVDSFNIFLWTPLQAAIKNTNLEKVKILLKYKCNINIRNQNGLSALMIAINEAENEYNLNKDKYEIIKLLLQNNADIDFLTYFVKNEKTKEILNKYNENNVINIKKLLNNGYKYNNGNYTLIHDLAKNKKYNELLLLLKDSNFEIDINAKTLIEGETILHIISKQLENTKIIMMELISLGALINIQNLRLETPLHLLKNYDLIEIYIKLGANPNIRDNNNKTFIEYCYNYINDDQFELLLSKTINITSMIMFNTITDCYSKISINKYILLCKYYPNLIYKDIKKHYNNCIKVLLSEYKLNNQIYNNNCIEKLKNEYKFDQFSIEYFSKKSHNTNLLELLLINNIKILEKIPFLYFVYNEYVQILLKYNYNINVVNHKGQNTLQILTYNYNNSFISEKYINELINNGININKRDHKGRTIFYYTYNISSIFDIILNKKFVINTNNLDKYGNSALDIQLKNYNRIKKYYKDQEYEYDIYNYYKQNIIKLINLGFKNTKLKKIYNLGIIQNFLLKYVIYNPNSKYLLRIISNF